MGEPHNPDLEKHLRFTITCTGCGRAIPAPQGNKLIQCKVCGKRMQVIGITPALVGSTAGFR